MDMMQYLDAIGADLINVTRLFGLEDAVLTAENPRITWRAWAEAEEYRCRCLCGDAAVERAVPVPPQEADERLQELHRKRAARRLVRQTMYELCREVTGIHPPWGSLTGIRPTHLMQEAIARGMGEDAAKRYVTETFDVTPEKADLLWEIAQVQGCLPPPEDRWMDVYIGIPFCTTRCTYCSFSSGELGKGKLVEPYLDALFREMDEACRVIPDSGRQLRAVYVGGGTPTSLHEDQLRRLLDRMMLRFPGAMEYTVEAGRPDTITPGKLAAIRDAGVGRISINPQTMNDETLRIIGRAHTAQQVVDGYAMAREAGIRHINMDVIAGLPGETVDDFARTMDWALRLKPESLTVHTLAIKRATRLHFENYRFPTGVEATQMVNLGMRTARALGLEPYYLYRQKNMAGNLENIGYAQPGHACQYNVDIMEETTHILALGAGGISKRIYEDEGHIGRAPNVANIEHYIARVDEMIGRKRELFGV
ncbi:MAG: coproporphyrinogen dehydrogenase HemZ [Clostridia bacterium]|nr:coproporphyrinogen dehydrogenase HemZ [Clostridia bacterium]